MRLMPRRTTAVTALVAAGVIGAAAGGGVVHVENKKHPVTVMASPSATPKSTPSSIILLSTPSPTASASPTPSTGLKVTNTTLTSLGQSGLLSLTGTLTNYSTEEQGTELLGTLYDKSGKVLATGSTTLVPLKSGASMNFAITSTTFTMPLSDVATSTVTVTKAP